MSAAQQSACPVCDGKGFVTTVRGPRVANRRKLAELASLAPPSRSSKDDPELAELLAFTLLRFQASWYVAELFRKCANDDYALSRAKWLVISQKIARGETP
jgi:hypothetical protein